MRVTIEAPEGWGPARALVGELQRLGYEIEEYIILGRRVIAVGAQPPAPDTGQPVAGR
jgi:hypothetical protein